MKTSKGLETTLKILRRKKKEQLKRTDVGEGSSKSGSIWTSTGNRTSVQNAFKHWKDHGKQFPGIQNAKQYANEAKNFLSKPPSGTLTKTRANGDIIRYNPSSNTFGVMTKDGVPKTMFKPKAGIKYFNRQ